MGNNKLKVIIVSEKTAIQSIISDIFTFGCLFGGFGVNYYFIGDSLVLKLFLVAVTLLLLVGYANRSTKKMSPADAKEFLKDK